MASERNERNDSKRGSRRESNTGGSGSGSNGGGSIPRNQETTVRAIFVLDEILKSTDPIDPNYQYLLLLRHQLEVDEQQSAEAQELIAKNHYRPRDPAVAAKHAADFPQLKLATIADFGGWKVAQKKYFADGGLFDAIMAKKAH